jgi:2,4-dienoyl-CoA reductase-like NADH-dependent reductase (Old Yellow Enzyme family)/NADPH-dependent 2,4-dienoyl-CoA reductase/sulfur reductase-like enzyme
MSRRAGATQLHRFLKGINDMKQKFNKLQSPMKIGRLPIPNRVVMPAMGTNIAAAGGGVNDDVIAYYEARARGGVGLIITEITRVADGAGGGEPCQLAARRPSDILELQKLADSIHKYDSKLFVQLQHPGREASPFVTGEQPVAPSAIANPIGGAMPRALSTEECEALVQKFVTGALYVYMGGIDGVELHAAHGYLLNEFLSPAMNQRTDRYGGSFENRMRFISEIIAGIREKCGPNFPISVRINAEEMFDGGINLDEAVRIAVALEQAGANAINVSCYTEGCIEPGTYAQGWKKHMAAAVKKAVSIPVISVCNIKEPAVAEELLAEGVCDFVGVGRGHLADPEWCNKAFSGRAEEIRKCIGCLGCFGEIAKLKRIKCAVNPLTGREREYAQPVRDGNNRVVVVIGGGPAGIEAALTLKDRGFRPVLFDDNSRLGGTLNTADKGYGKEKITRYVDSLIAQATEAGIEVRLNEKATIESLRALEPFGVFVACGAEPSVPPIPGVDGENVVTAEDVLLGAAKPAGRVAVIGSGMTGLETAEILAMNGCRLTLVEMLESVGPGIYPAVVMDIMKRILPHNPQVLTGHRLEKISSEGIELQRLLDGKTVTIDVDKVVLSLGVRPDITFVDEIRSAFARVRVVGDAVQGGRIMEATHDAHGKAFVFGL